MNKTPRIWIALWQGTCTRYTVLCLLLLVTSAIFSGSLTVTYVDTVRFFLLLPFALCLTLANRVRHSPRLSLAPKVGLHVLSVLGGFYLFCYLPYQIRTSPHGMQILLILLLAILLYGLVMGVVLALSAVTRRRKQEQTPYESQFSKK